MREVNIIGVPEHFNYPWHLAIAEGIFENRGIDLSWTDIPEGTGRMVKMLAENEADMAIVLTEGMVKSIADGNTARIVQVFISSPLLWGIHVDHSSDYHNVSSLEGSVAAISRFGSGSHLMAYVNAENNHWNTTDLKFETVNTLDNAVVKMKKGEADYFMWEHFTTKPLVDQGIFRRLGDCPTPWPCFVIAVSERFYSKEKTILKHILEIINNYTEEFKFIPSMDRSISNAYEQKLQDVRHWLALTEWGNTQLTEEELQKVQTTLKRLNLIEDIKEPNDFLINLND